MPRWSLVGFSFAMLSTASSLHAQAPSQQSLLADAAAFGARQSVTAPDLSPDGSSVLYLTPGPGKRTVAVLGNLASGKFTTVVSTDGEPESLRWCGFASTQRAVCSFGGLVESKSIGELLGFSRLVSLDLNGGNAKLLGQAQSIYDSRLRQDDGDIVDWLGQTENAVLMSRDYVPEAGKIGSNIVRVKNGRGVDKINVSTMRSEPIEAPRAGAWYVTDGRGNVRIMAVIGARDSGMLTGKTDYFYRVAGSREWKPLLDALDEDFQPLAVDANTNSLYALKKHNSRMALYRASLDAQIQMTLVADHPRVDIEDVVKIGEGGRVVGYTFVDDKRQTVYFDAEYKALSTSLSKALANLPLITFIDASSDGSKILLVAESDNDPGRFYLFDRKAKTLNEAMFARPELKGRTLALVKPVTIPGHGGVSIPAYLTLPPGREAKGLPAVVLPHGGPSARDEWGFDWLAQFLAARGYAVLQPQYRGSAGFGDAWLNENGYRNWRTSIGDILASARWLAAQGISDPSKLAIVGASYGGYAALQSAVTEPALYKAIVAIAPVTDLAQLKQDSSNFTNANLRAKQIGSGPHVAEGSPLRNPSSIAAPVLLIHGDRDANVRVWHSQKMHDALRAAGKKSELLTLRGVDHYFEDSSARTDMLARIGGMLDATIGR